MPLTMRTPPGYSRWRRRQNRGCAGQTKWHWLNRIAIDLNNIRATSSWLTGQGRIAEAIELYANIEWFLFIRGHAVESRSQFEAWLTRPELEGDDRSRALALFFAGARATDLGNRTARYQ